MKVTNAEFTISAVGPNQYPTDQKVEIALSGRSNVGKSSFINRLIQRKSLARTSSKPGKTQTLNFYHINDLFYFVDVPGYGYAKVSKKEREKWGKMIEEYITTRENLELVLILVDFRHEPSTEDVQMHEFLEYYEIPYRIIMTKCDKIPRGKWNKHVSQIRKAFGKPPEELFLTFSSETGEGVEKAWEWIESVVLDEE